MSVEAVHGFNTSPPRQCWFNIFKFLDGCMRLLNMSQFLMPYKDIAWSASQACQECCLCNSQSSSLSLSEVDNLYDLESTVSVFVRVFIWLRTCWLVPVD